mmetsp:Transcript_48904/g.122488  ORF Transcript_48904/g.122488 Transcript_48904/m.122488 type:complete len:205 (+) Transcript_48904:1251-1865(+)
MHEPFHFPCGRHVREREGAGWNGRQTNRLDFDKLFVFAVALDVVAIAVARCLLLPPLATRLLEQMGVVFVVDPLGLIQVLVERLDRHGVVARTLFILALVQHIDQNEAIHSVQWVRPAQQVRIMPMHVWRDVLVHRQQGGEELLLVGALGHGQAADGRGGLAGGDELGEDQEGRLVPSYVPVLHEAAQCVRGRLAEHEDALPLV